MEEVVVYALMMEGVVYSDLLCSSVMLERYVEVSRCIA